MKTGQQGQKTTLISIVIKSRPTKNRKSEINRVFHIFSYQNTAKTGIYSKSSMLNLILAKCNPIKTGKPIFLGFSHKMTHYQDFEANDNLVQRKIRLTRIIHVTAVMFQLFYMKNRFLSVFRFSIGSYFITSRFSILNLLSLPVLVLFRFRIV